MSAMKPFQAAPASTSEDELIRRAQSADMDAFCLLAQRFERRIHSLALHYCHNHQDAEDLSQEVWLKSYQALNTFRGESSFYTWLRKITINCFLNHQRARSFRWHGQTTGIRLFDVDAIETNEHRSPAADSENALINRIMVERVMQALSESAAGDRGSLVSIASTSNNRMPVVCPCQRNERARWWLRKQLIVIFRSRVKKRDSPLKVFSA